MLQPPPSPPPGVLELGCGGGVWGGGEGIGLHQLGVLWARAFHFLGFFIVFFSFTGSADNFKHPGDAFNCWLP